MKFLIINADDFGLEKEINEAIVKGHRDGILTSASMMANGNAFDHAVDVASQYPQLGIGIHLTLVGGGAPVFSGTLKSSLVTEEGVFFSNYADFIKKDLRGEISLQDVYNELSAQFEKIISSGVRVTHVDGHQHLHIWPRVLPLIISLCQKHHIRCIRVPEENMMYGKHLVNFARFVGKAGLTALATRARYKVIKAGMVTTDHFWGMMDGGKLTEIRLLDIISHLQPGFHEIMCHPGTDTNGLSIKYGWGYEWEKELAGLTSSRVYRKIVEEQIHRIHFGDLVI